MGSTRDEVTEVLSCGFCYGAKGGTKRSIGLRGTGRGKDVQLVNLSLWSGQ